MTNNAALIALASFAALLIAYQVYGRFLARRIFRLDSAAVPPSKALEDGVDFVPTRAPILFGHHFASIAGLGPILGPAIAVFWGWVPAILWIVCGSIFIGAVHDLGSLVVSARHQGRSMGDICNDLMGPRARLLALVLIFFLLALAMGIFVIVISRLFVFFTPTAVVPSLGLMIVAMGMGIAVYNYGAPLGITTLIGLSLFAGLIVLGVEFPVASYRLCLDRETDTALTSAWSPRADGTGKPLEPALEGPCGTAAAIKYFKEQGNERAAASVEAAAKSTVNLWVGVLLAYGFVASVLPVWLLLQPRDYINSFQLYFALAAMFLGLLVAAITGSSENYVDAAPFRLDVPDADPWMPLLFITIACGAVSGFHSLVSSGTTVKQLKNETDALPIGYGGMLTEAALAILVVLACCAGLGAHHWSEGGIYATWGGIHGAGLATQLNAVIAGGANFLAQLGIPAEYGQAILAVTVVAFALTTLDSGTRLLRFNVEELCRSVRLGFLANRYFASAAAVGGIAFFALNPAGTSLWTLFGSSNQLLAGLTLLSISVFLYQRRRPVWYTLLPMVFMTVVATWAICLNMGGFRREGKWSLFVVSAVILLIAFWLVIEAIITFFTRKPDASETAETGNAG